MTLGWLEAFVLVLSIEVPIVLWLTRDLGVSWVRRGMIATLAQLVTHPIVWFVLPFVPGMTHGGSLLVSALWSWSCEALLYVVGMPPLRPLRAARISFFANAASLVAGLLLHGR